MERVSDLFIDSQIKAHEALAIGSNTALALQELQRWRRVEAVLRDKEAPIGCNPIVRECLRIIDEPTPTPPARKDVT